jgi:hypothetical protein
MVVVWAGEHVQMRSSIDYLTTWSAIGLLGYSSADPLRLRDIISALRVLTPAWSSSILYIHVRIAVLS